MKLRFFIILNIIFLSVFIFFHFYDRIFKIKELSLIVSEPYMDQKLILKLFNQSIHSLLFFKGEKKFKKAIQKLYPCKKIEIWANRSRHLYVKIEGYELIAFEIQNKKKKLFFENGDRIFEEKRFLKESIPQIELKNKIKNQIISHIIKQLAILKFNDLNFFHQISKIELKDKNTTHIFLKSLKRVYQVQEPLTLKLLVKIKWLEAQGKNWPKVVKLNGNVLLLSKD